MDAAGFRGVFRTVGARRSFLVGRPPGADDGEKESHRGLTCGGLPGSGENNRASRWEVAAMSLTEWESGLVRLDKNSQGILAEASRIARAEGAEAVTTAHLLLVLVEAVGRPHWLGFYPDDSAQLAERARELLTEVGIDASGVRPLLTRPWARESPRGDALDADLPGPEHEALPWSRYLPKVVAEARREANADGSFRAAPFHLLVAVTAPHWATAASKIIEELVDDPPEDQRWLHARLARLTTGRAPAPASARGGV